MEHTRFYLSPEIIEQMSKDKLWHIIEVSLEAPNVREIYIDGEKYEDYSHWETENDNR